MRRLLFVLFSVLTILCNAATLQQMYEL